MLKWNVCKYSDLVTSEACSSANLCSQHFAWLHANKIWIRLERFGKLKEAKIQSILNFNWLYIEKNRSSNWKVCWLFRQLKQAKTHKSIKVTMYHLKGLLRSKVWNISFQTYLNVKRSSREKFFCIFTTLTSFFEIV